MFENETWNTFDSIDTILTEPDEPLEGYIWDKPQEVSPWNSY
jgi:hypothetical protein